MRFVLCYIGDMVIRKGLAAIPAAIIIPETDAIEAGQAFCCSDPYKATGILRDAGDGIITKSIDGSIVLEK